ncbi:MAG TPA: Gfo/Idh/MocA family oxidoreductase [Bradyrhizobium sp.]
MQSRKLRLIQVGVSGWGETWLQRSVASPTWDLAAIVDLDPAALDTAVATHALDPNIAFRSLREAARQVHADAALIVVPAAAHLPVTLEAFGAGLHVLSEKPLADTMANAHRMAQASRAAGKTLMVSQNYRFRRAALVVTKIMQAGWLGRLGHANVTFRKEIYFSKPPEPHGFALYNFIRDGAIHHLDQIRGLLLCEPKKVYGHSYNPPWSWFKEPPMVNAIIEMEGGGVVEYFGSWTARGTQTTFDGDWYIECERGQIDFRGNRVLVHPEETWLTIQMDGFLERNGWMEAEIPMDTLEDRSYALEEFGRCLIKGRVPSTCVEDNLKSLALAFALRDSAMHGEPKDIAPYLDPGNFERPA